MFNLQKFAVYCRHAPISTLLTCSNVLKTYQAAQEPHRCSAVSAQQPGANRDSIGSCTQVLPGWCCQVGFLLSGTAYTRLELGSTGHDSSSKLVWADTLNHSIQALLGVSQQTSSTRRLPVPAACLLADTQQSACVDAVLWRGSQVQSKQHWVMQGKCRQWHACKHARFLHLPLAAGLKSCWKCHDGCRACTTLCMVNLPG